MKSGFLGIAILSIGLAPRPAAAQPDDAGPTAIVIRPAVEPVPALRYRWVPEPRDLRPGNAAIFYHRAILMVQERRRAMAAEARPGASKTESPEEAQWRWATGPIDAIPRDEARATLARFASALREAELGARSRSCDWELGDRAEGLTLLIPEIQEMRSLGRLVILAARLAILEGRPDEAFRHIQTGYAMARHTGEAPFLISTLVGIAISSQMGRPFEELIQSPGAPSLAWALATRPRPLIASASALEAERLMIEKEVPALRTLEDGPWTLDEARRFADDLQRKLAAYAESGPLTLPREAGPSDAPRLADLAPRLTLAAVVAKVYPKARRSLIAGGMPEAQVDAMPTIQVAALHAYRRYARMRDDLYKQVLSTTRGRPAPLDDSPFRTVEDKMADPLVTIFAMLLPALNSVRMAEARAERQLDTFQVIEAIRLYAGAHDGALPPDLDAIKEAPVPPDPATGRPFDYRREGDAATLSAPLMPGAPDMAYYRIRYELGPTR